MKTLNYKTIKLWRKHAHSYFKQNSALWQKVLVKFQKYPHLLSFSGSFAFLPSAFRTLRKCSADGEDVGADNRSRAGGKRVGYMACRCIQNSWPLVPVYEHSSTVYFLHGYWTIKNKLLICYGLVSVWIYFPSASNFPSSFLFVFKELFYFLFYFCSQFFSFSSSFCELILFILVLVLVLVHNNIIACYPLAGTVNNV